MHVVVDTKLETNRCTHPTGVERDPKEVDEDWYKEYHPTKLPNNKKFSIG